MSDPISFFSGSKEGRCLSNFFVADFEIVLKIGTFRFSTAEAAYQCLKQPRLTKGKVRLFQVMAPTTAREYGKQMPIREDWDQIKDDAMRHVLRAKFTNPDMRAYLLGTGERELVHWAPWDGYWGTGRDGNGQNKLGVFLMQLRDELRVPTA
jgi:ribA/ribD-fused uncharacterized protein